MANHKSAIKQHKKSSIKAKLNSSVRSRIKTFIRKVDSQVSLGNFDNAIQAFRVAESEIMKSVGKGILKLNTASRKVSYLAKKVKSIDSSYTSFKNV